MSNRGKHLLEAFSSGANPAAPPPAPTPLPQAARASVPSPLLASAGPLRLRASQWQLLILLQVVLLVVAFLLGRRSARTAEAAARGEPDTTEAPAAQRAPEPASPAPAANDPRAVANLREAAENALRDRSNVYTIKVIEYADSAANQQRAAAACAYLTNVHGLPACVTITGTTASRLHVVVGAAPDTATLEQVRDIVRSIDGPPPTSIAREFHDAYA